MVSHVFYRNDNVKGMVNDFYVYLPIVILKLPPVTWSYLHGVTCGYLQLPGITCDYLQLPGVTCGYF